LTVDVSLAAALQRRVDLQDRLWQTAQSAVVLTGKNASATQLHRELRNYLVHASDQGLLREGPKVIYQELLLSGPDKEGVFDIAVGLRPQSTRP
jgi:hypothetical protein